MEILTPQFYSLPLATVIGGLIAYIALRANHNVQLEKLKRLEDEHMKSKVQLMDF